MADRGTILVIDDDPTFLTLATVVLRRHGYAVQTASNSEEGLTRMTEQKPSLVILDIMLEWALAGVTLSREMMERHELSRIPIIMCTAIRNSDCAMYFPQDEYLHVDRWLDKPCSPDELAHEVTSTLEHYARHAWSS